MTRKHLHKTITLFIATVWIVNGLFCKVLDLVPRHREIVASILGSEYATPLTVAIGIAEIGMAVWVLSGIKTRLNAVAQIVIVGVMNLLEFILVPDLLLWGRANALFALMFILIVYYSAFVLYKPVAQVA